MSSLQRLSGARRRLMAMVLLAVVFVSACADDKPLNTFEPAGPKAEEIDNLMSFVWVVMGAVFVIITGVSIYIAIRFRVRADDDDPEDLPPQLHGNTRVEVLWTAIPAIILASIAIPTVAKIWSLEETNDPGELDVMVIGQQWWWEYRYDIDGDGFFVDANGDGAIDELDQELPLSESLDPDDLVTANELVIPAGQQVDLILTSRDVIHSFWIPRLNGKRDTVPGRFHTWSVEANEPGKYTGWCTEFCGMSHARMRMSVIALTEADYDQWWENQQQPAEVPTDEQALRGRAVFITNCVSCHVVDDGDIAYDEDFEAALISGAAPNLTHFATRTSFAGATHNQYLGPGTDPDDDALDVSQYVEVSQLAADESNPDGYRWNTEELKRWVSDASGQKDMAPDELRGMPSFPQLTDQDLDDVVAYLATLD